jgi:beta-lactamase class A
MLRKFISTLCLIALCCPQIFSQIPATKELKGEIDGYAATARGRVGVSVKLLETGESIGSFEDQRFPMQSVYKFPIGMTVLHQVDQGRLRLNQSVHIVAADYVSSAQHSPIRDKYPTGTLLTVRELLRSMVSESDGSACDVLLRLIGGPQTVMAYLHGLGVQGFNIVSTEKEIGSKNSVQYDNWATPAAAVTLLQKFHEGKGLSKASQQLLWQLMTQTPTGLNRIKGLLPKGTIVAHKTGTSGTVDGITAATNDIGLIALPNGQHLAVAVFVSDAPGETKERERVIANISLAAWNYWTVSRF